MKTEDILNLDCTKCKNTEKINKLLYKTGLVSFDGNGIIPVDVLEDVLHKFYINNKYRIQYIDPYYEDDRFVFYTVSVIKRSGKTNEWKGDVTGKSLWECVAKSIIKIYALLRKEGKKDI